MTDRILTVEFAPVSLEHDAGGNWTQPVSSDYRSIPNTNSQYWVSEHKLDLSGYVLSDLTVYFRNSFEQRGGGTSYQWVAGNGAAELKPFDAANLELTIISSVPMTDAQLSAAFFSAPGFVPLRFSPALDFGNFDRTHIIHGTGLIWSIDTSIGANSLDRNGAAYGVVVQNYDFSSLEPTAADCLYCYRMLALSRPTNGSTTGLSRADYPPKRVLLSAVTDSEPDLEYLMRLKRSYELANQV